MEQIRKTIPLTVFRTSRHGMWHSLKVPHPPSGLTETTGYWCAAVALKAHPAISKSPSMNGAANWGSGYRVWCATQLLAPIRSPEHGRGPRVWFGKSDSAGTAHGTYLGLWNLEPLLGPANINVCLHSHC